MYGDGTQSVGAHEALPNEMESTVSAHQIRMTIYTSDVFQVCQ